MTQRPDRMIEILRENGYEAFYVGGCVRDSLLERPVHDWDIATSALPSQIMSTFDRCEPTGFKHGTVTVHLDGASAEITTYRADGDYLDGRRPQSVAFVKELSLDLLRRDFTINAMAMDEKGNITDLFEGQKDLERRCIRCVGEPDVRFSEDALRMLRATRFAAQLGFDIEARTESSIRRNAVLCRKLSAERVRDEIKKVLCSSETSWLDRMADMGLLERCFPTEGTSCGELARLPEDELVRWAGLCSIWENLDLHELRLDKRTADLAMLAGRCHVPDDRLSWKVLIVEHGEECAIVVAELAGKIDEVREILLSGECLSLRQLAVNGSDFPELSGPQLGAHLKKLLYHVLNEPQSNKKEILTQMK